MKRCNKCKIEKEENEFHISRAQKDGLQGTCKICASKIDKQYRKDNREKLALQHHEYHKVYYQKNKEMIKAKVQVYKRNNKEAVNKSTKKWRDKNPQLVKDIKKRSYQNNRAVHEAGTRKRELGKIQRTPKNVDWEKIKDIYKERDKRTQETGIPHEVDHIYPLHGKTVSGFHIHFNLQILPRTQNRRKHNHLPGLEVEKDE